MVHGVEFVERDCGLTGSKDTQEGPSKIATFAGGVTVDSELRVAVVLGFKISIFGCLKAM